MDEGIRARTLAADVRSAVEDDDVRAIILRVDSPGGDGLASDYVAEALRKAKGKKPVIVSQGSVAASGGYWLSMYGDTIVAAPTTITGSIGVAGGWMYNTDLKQKLGMTTDHVRVGKHADLGFGFTLPLLGLGIPDRNLTAEERSTVEGLMRYHYADFEGKVATGRGMSRDSVERIAQGRVWSGRDALDNGLVDVLGGLETAIGIAKAGAGIDAADEVRIEVSPEPGLFDFSVLMPRLLGTNEEQDPDPVIEQIRFRLKHNGVPMPVMPLEEMEYTFE
jgi:protease-4